MQVDIFVHPGFPLTNSFFDQLEYRMYREEIRQVARSSLFGIHIVERRVQQQDMFIDEYIPESRKVSSYFFDRYSFGAISQEDIGRYHALLRDVDPSKDCFRIHGAYYGICTLDAALHTYWMLIHGEERQPSFSISLFEQRRSPLLLDGDALDDFSEHIDSLSSVIRFGTVYGKRNTKSSNKSSNIRTIRKEFMEAMTDKNTKVYTPRISSLQQKV